MFVKMYIIANVSIFEQLIQQNKYITYIKTFKLTNMYKYTKTNEHELTCYLTFTNKNKRTQSVSMHVR